MNIEHLKVRKEDIEAELNELKQAVEKGFVNPNNKIVNDLLKVYKHLENNGKIIDIHKVFHDVGLNENQDPKLAIIRADGRFCHIYKMNNGGAVFSINPKDYWKHNALKSEGDIKLPSGTFLFQDLTNQDRYKKCAVPIIPPRVNLAVSTRIISHHYHILFETEGWVPYDARPQQVRDPILGKMLTSNLFGVLATWDLSDLELMIIKGATN